MFNCGNGQTDTIEGHEPLGQEIWTDIGFQREPSVDIVAIPLYSRARNTRPYVA